MGHTFIAGCLVELSFQLVSHGNMIPTTRGALIALVAALVRSGVKSVDAALVVQIQAWKNSKVGA